MIISGIVWKTENNPGLRPNGTPYICVFSIIKYAFIAQGNFHFYLPSFAANPYSDSSVGDDYYSDDYYADDDSADDDYLNENERVVHTVPEFVSKPTDVWVNEGDTIKLPCLVDKLGEYLGIVIILSCANLYLRAFGILLLVSCLIFEIDVQ